ncbi:lysophosphatidic acid receptor 5-like [Protopterus annectens]|uniref:lysophosphatidic acid receptor 5-like n=1 Tax=Protopterus annectens TaxID=7888 RepID=UPI001CFB64EB|nr:lysophosphatidic acid receptor 5-like [Protopterus annectens]XP_043935506.1 lysophosphatidic acid receptor 5-like [Protopterus annectens]
METNDSNRTCEFYNRNHPFLLGGYIVIFVIGLILNSTSIFVFIYYFRMNTVVTIYMCNLAVSDLLFTLSLPFRMHYYANSAWSFGNVPCQISGSLFQINMYGSCLFLLCINIDRFLAVVYPLRLRHLRRQKVAHMVCLSVWIVIILFCAPVARMHKTTQCTYFGSGKNETLCFESFTDDSWKDNIIPLVITAEILGFLLPLSVVTYCTTHTLVVLFKRRSEHSTRGIKTIRLLVVNMVIFVVCFVPYNTTLAIYSLLKSNGHSQLKSDTVRSVLFITIMMASVNCVLDPLVYYFSTEGFRSTFRNITVAQKKVNNSTAQRVLWKGSNKKEIANESKISLNTCLQNMSVLQKQPIEIINTESVV